MKFPGFQDSFIASSYEVSGKQRVMHKRLRERFDASPPSAVKGLNSFTITL